MRKNHVSHAKHVCVACVTNYLRIHYSHTTLAYDTRIHQQKSKMRYILFRMRYINVYRMRNIVVSHAKIVPLRMQTVFVSSAKPICTVCETHMYRLRNPHVSPAKQTHVSYAKPTPAKANFLFCQHLDSNKGPCG